MIENKTVQEQNVILVDRHKITVTGIASVDSFNDQLIIATTVNGLVINIEGTELVIKDVNLDRSQIEAEGNISAFFYETETKTENLSFLRKLLNRQ